MDEDGEIRIQLLTTIDGKRFTEIVNDISDVQCEDIIASSSSRSPGRTKEMGVASCHPIGGLPFPAIV
ncbi:hypothetical protein TNCT_600781 [Trichonephila clavata]|uniref:Uncharacterized protein n=1 Tax=Trichonephila clavata TaxID=2740835 RepID=A0A8X6GQ07_TRICU|nr:hypothetical protein TNCT_600781 [Trichonephila clavata]